LGKGRLGRLVKHGWLASMQSQTKSIGPYKLVFDPILLANDLQHIPKAELDDISDFLYDLEQQPQSVTIDCNGQVQNIYYGNM
jgi:hypothetical protein